MLKNVKVLPENKTRRAEILENTLGFGDEEDNFPPGTYLAETKIDGSDAAVAITPNDIQFFYGDGYVNGILKGKRANSSTTDADSHRRRELIEYLASAAEISELLLEEIYDVKICREG